MKTLTTIFTTISVLTWWHIPVVAMIFSLINTLILIWIKFSETHYKVVFAITVLIVCLSVWNWDLHIGVDMIEKYMEIIKIRY